MFELLKGLGSDNESIAGVLDVALDYLSSLALYLTIALIVGIVIYAIVIRNRDEDYLSKARKGILGVVIGYAIGVIGVLGLLKITVKVLEEAFDSNFWITMGLFALVIVGIATCLTLKKRNFSGTKWVALGFAVAFGVYCIVLAVTIPTDETFVLAIDQNWLMLIVTALVVAIIVTIALLDNTPTQDNTKALSYGAVCVALSFALSYIKFFSMPQGGSVTFASMLPLMLYSYMFGTRRGVVAGVVYGLLQFVQSPQFYQPVQMLVDYPIAFASIGTVGIARKFAFLKGNAHAEFAIGAVIGSLLRFVSHVISGYFVFSAYADLSTTTALGYSLAYNSFVFVDVAIVIAMGLFALSFKNLRNIVKSANVPQADFE